jgi:hypothetical protein
MCLLLKRFKEFEHPRQKQFLEFVPRLCHILTMRAAYTMTQTKTGGMT